jgi:hypothetical protein
MRLAASVNAHSLVAKRFVEITPEQLNSWHRDGPLETRLLMCDASPDR